MESESHVPFHLHQNLDVLDTVNKWCNAEILSLSPNQLYIWYTGYTSKYNQWLPLDSHRILTQWNYGSPIQINNRLDVKHPLPKQWLEAKVIEVDGENAKVHFFNYHAKYDIWVDLNNREQVAPVGTHSKAHGSGKKRGKQITQISAEILNKLKKLHASFKESLKNRKLVIREVGGDGNCLFRTISDQLYGVENHHRELRQVVMDYILKEKDFFMNYVEGDIDEYIEKKRMDGVWGDDVELQAVSEIYNRPIEVYVNDDKPIRTFHEDNDQNILPLRVSYQGSCHYNSIKEEGFQNVGLMQDKFPIWQNFFLNNLEAPQHIQDVYRSQFANKGSIDQTINTCMNFEAKDEAQVEDEMIKLTETATLLDEIEKSEIKEVALQQEKERIEEEMRRIEEMEIQQIKKQSLAEMAKAERTQREKQQEVWVQSIREQGFTDDEILLAIAAKGNNPDAVLNYLYDSC